jgi:hypothetical protein
MDFESSRVFGNQSSLKDRKIGQRKSESNTPECIQLESWLLKF